MNTDLKIRTKIILLDYLAVLQADKKDLNNRDYSEFNEQLKVYNQQDINKVEKLINDLNKPIS